MNKYAQKIKIAFLDRDGTLIYEPPDTKQVDSLEKLRILPGVNIALKALLDQGYKLIMVSNQDGLGTKAFPMRDFVKVQKRLLEMFKVIYRPLKVKDDRKGVKKNERSSIRRNRGKRSSGARSDSRRSLQGCYRKYYSR